MRPQVWLVRSSVLAVILAPLGLLLLPRPRPPENNLDRVYDSLGGVSKYADLEKWCGLRRTPATADEVDQLNAVIMSANDIREHFFFGDGSRLFAESVSRSDRFRWVRLHHPTDPNRWIGVGVLNHYNTGAGFQDYVVFRVRIGFKPVFGPVGAVPISHSRSGNDPDRVGASSGRVPRPPLASLAPT